MRTPHLKLFDSVTNSDGRCLDLLLPPSSPTESSGNLEDGILRKGLYKIIFKTKDYFQSRNTATFYPWVEVSAILDGCIRALS